MLRGIPKIISPELLKTLAEMGHGDEIVIGDANFPSTSLNSRVIRADGIKGDDLLAAILTLIPLDSYAEYNILLMETTNGDPTPKIWKNYDDICEKDSNYKKGTLPRFDFYDRAKKAFAIVASGEEQIYANIIIKKGVI